MKFENDFDVEAPIEEVFKALLDVERVAPCVPGAQVVEHTDEDVYKVAIKVKVGPMSMQYHGEVKIVESDPDHHRAVMRTRAKEARGQGTADANVEMRLEGDDSRTHGTISTDVKLSGRAAAMGGGIIQDVSARIVDTFATNLAAMLGEGGKSPAVETPAPAEAAPPTALVPERGAPADAVSAHEPEGEPPHEAAAAPEPAAERLPEAAAAPEAAAETPHEAAAAAASEPAESESTPPPWSAPSSDDEASLPVLSIMSSVITGRLRDPKALGATLGVVAILAFVLGRRGR